MSADMESPHFDPAEALRVAFESRDRVERGIYCECAEPDLHGVALMCFRCECRNRGQEIRRIHLSIDAHDFEQGSIEGWCALCVRPEDDPRHQGIPGIGATSWGESVQGVAAVFPADTDTEQ